MKILAIETSCDDTCIAIIEADKHRLKRGFARMEFNILSNIISSQVKIHRKWGGVYPSLAKREHQKNLPIVLRKSLKETGKPKIDLIAVTIGPGLEPCLWVGVNFARALAFSWKLPIVPVNHIEAHIFANLITRPGLVIQFPAVCLVVSGGHSQLILMKAYGEYKILGETRDDAAGECFDKVARILGMGYPGGPAIEAEASKFSNFNSQFSIKLPRPMIHQKNFDFSFSGLKTAVLYHHKNQPPKVRTSKRYIQAMSAEVQQAIIDVLIKKTIKAAREYKAQTIILGGGVVANQELRKRFKNTCLKPEVKPLNCLVPPKRFCTDNAAMVVATAYLRWLKEEKKNWQEVKAEANIKIC